ncbi:CHAT domain-containing protein, partial [Dapis sp. BLCC M172]|uniref:CHAT domain-containing protein n=1 Tax=Dapis sp. BLCC M172 TaxID=2975281 RepID=UPI003CFB519C
SDIDSRSKGSGQGGSINLESTGGNVDTSGGELSSFSELGNAGGVNITSSGNLTTSDIDSRSKGSGQGGSINLESTGGNVDTSGGELSSFSQLGNAGNVNIISNTDLITGTINSRSEGNGQGGDVTLTAKGKIDAGSVESFSRQGTGGDITIIGDGDINISSNQTDDEEAGINSRAGTSSDGGNIEIKSQTGNVTINSELSSSSQTGNGGNIKISAGGDINTTSGELGSFSGEEINQNQNSQTLAGQNQGGQGGDITLEAEGEINAGVLQSFSREGSGGSITLEAKGNITTSEIISSAADPEDRPPVGGENSGNQIITQSQVEEPTSRQSGNIRIESTEGTVKTQGEIISYSNQGNAGNIDVISNSDVDIADGATIDSRADSSGNGGAIKIESKTGAITINSELSSSSQTGEGGPVEIRATGNITSGTISSFSEGNGNGGNITLESTGGDINTTSGELGSFSGEEIDETPGSQTFAGGNQGGQGGNITLEAEGNIDVGDIESFSREGSGGSITLEAKGNITTTNEIISSAADPEERPAVGGENSGNQTITQSQVEEPTGRQSGNIRIESKEGTVKTQGEIISYSNDGPGGNISIIGDGDIDIRTGAIDSRTDSTNRTNGGEIFIESKTGNITIEGELSSSSQTGKGGDIDINAPGDITSEAISSYSDGNGDGGAINITSTQGNLTIGEILSSSGEPIAQRAQNPEQTNSNSGENTTGGGGAITLKADEGNITVGDIESFSRQGAAGDISVSAKGNIITDAIISSAGDPENIPAPGRNADNATRTQSQVEEQNNRPAGGDISIISTEGTVTTNAEITSYSDKGNGGNISIFSQGDIRIITDSTPKTNAANIDSRSDGTSGSGGNIMLESQTGIIDAPGEFASSSQTGNGGNVEIFAPGNIQVETILSFSEGDGNGGDVNITGDSSIQTGTIASFTAGSGNSGNISIFADGAIDTSVGQLLSFSAEGEGGNVTLSATENITTGFIESFSGGGTRGGNITLETTNGNIDTTVGPLDVAIDLDIDIVGLSLGAEANISTDADVSSPDVATIFAEERANLSSSAPEGTGGNILIIQQGQGEITTSNISSFGGEDSGSVNIINNDGNINTGVIFSTAINGTGGQISLETMNNGDLNINHIATYADTENGVGGDISLDASGVVNINNIASFGNAGSGDVTIQSSSGSINTGTIQTRAPNGTSGNITLNTFSTQGDIRTASVTTQGGAAAGQVEIIATDGSVTTEDLESSSESGSAGGINVVAGEDIETGDQTVDSATGDATINNEAGGDITTGDQTAITSVGDATINNVAGGDITTGDQTAITGEGDATINNEAGRDITTGDQTAITGEGDATINNVTGGDITTGDQTAITSVGDATINNEAGGNIITGDQTAITSVGDATINNVTGGDITTGDITGIGDITNIINQPGGELNTGEIIQINPSPSIPTDNTLPQLLPQTSVTPGNLSNLTQLPVTPGNLPNLTQLPITQTPINQNIPPSNNQVLNPVTTQIIQSVQGNSTITTTNNPNLPNKQSDRQKVNINTDTTTALENINIVNSTPLTVAANSQTLITIEQTRNDEFEDYFESDLSNQITSTQNIREVLIDIARQTGNNSAIIYVTAYPDALQLVLYTPGSDPILKTIPNTNRKELMKALLTLRAQITNPARRYTNSYLPPAQKLYNWLIAPILAELEAANIDTLLFSMDEGLRALPVAVLHDGEQFLVEKYSLSLIPSVSLMDTNYRPLQDTQVLAMGASEFIEQSALPAVPTELETISQKLWQGSKFINEEFTRNNLLAQRENYSYPIIHLATHAEFKPGKANNSYIQLWGDEQLKLDQIRELGWNEPAVELLVLSACRTAFGDKNAELGFAGLAVAAGVKSALASIWYVSDEGTLGLMTEFYVHLNNAKIKAEALRQAQLAMLRGEVVIAEGELRGPGIRGAVVLPPALGKFENKNLSHPYYWSGFMMIGSPW